MVNPYYYFFYLVYRVLDPIAKEKDRLPFGVISLMGVFFIIHTLILVILIKKNLNYQVLPRMNKFVFGSSLTILYLVLNHFLFEKNDRYIRIVNEIKTASKLKKINTTLFLLAYMLIPLFLNLLT